METLSDIRGQVQSSINVGDNSSLFPPTTIDNAIIRAEIKISRLFRWPQLEDAKLTTTQANHEYYDLPDKWSPDSVFRLEIDGTPYGSSPDFSPMSFQSYLNWKADSNNENSTDKKWSVHGNQYFVYPTPTEAGLEIAIHGQKTITPMTVGDDTATTIFSENMPECNEAIMLEATAILKKKGESDKVGELFSAEAKGIVALAFTKLKQEVAKEELDQPILEVTDMFRKASPSETIGRFS